MTGPGAGRRWLCAVALAVLILQIGCRTHSAPDPGDDSRAIVVTQIPVGAEWATPTDRLDIDRRYPEGSRIVLLHPDVGPTEGRILSNDLFAAGAPSVSPDGRRILFTARRAPGTRWGIYEASVGRSGPRALIEVDSDCIDPVYLGADRIVFVCAEAPAHDEDRTISWSLFTATGDGSGMQRVTFGPGSAFDPTALADGRILFSMRQGPGIGRTEVGASALFTVNPDGTLLDAFVGSHVPADEYRARETRDGGVVFLAREAAGNAARIERVELRAPQATRRVLTIAVATESSHPAFPSSVEPLPDGDYLVAALGTGMRPSTQAVFRVGREGGTSAKLVYDDPEWHETEALLLTARPAPRGRPSPVDPELDTGTVVCYDTSRSDGVVGPSENEAPATSVSVRAYSDGRADRRLAEVPVEGDGSFYIEVPADTPLRVVSLNGSGQEIAASDWFWVRPGEVRACFGCHESRDAAPVNRTIAALSNPPRSVPAERAKEAR